MAEPATPPLEPAGVPFQKKLRTPLEPHGPKSQPGTEAGVKPFAPVSRLMYTPAKVLGTLIGVLNVTTTALASVTMPAVPASAAAHMPKRMATDEGSRVGEAVVLMLI